MAIDKVFPRRLNSSTDVRLRGQNEMIDAINVTVDENDGEFGDENNLSPSGNLGVLKPVKGTVETSKDESYDLEDDNNKVIGQVVDERANKIYSFVFSGTSANHGVYVLDVETNVSSEVLTSPLFNFRQYDHVDADIVYVPRDGGLTPIIFFTDGFNEPRKLDVARVADAAAYVASGEDYSFLDFISVCPRVPLQPITFQWTQEEDRYLSNFKGKRGYQFAYQTILAAGDVTPLSVYSKLAVPPSYVQQGSRTAPNLNEHNKLNLFIPKSEFTGEASKARVLFREGNDGAWYILDEFDVSSGSTELSTSSNGLNYVVPFLADAINSVVPEGETARLFDAVPKNAKAQAVTNNRLFYGNYSEGYDVPKISVTISHNFEERPEDFISYEIDAEAVLKEVNHDYVDPQGEQYTAPKNRVSAYRIDVSNMPTEGLGENVRVSLTISVKPDRDFHLYESRRGMHKTRYVDKNNLTKSDDIGDQIADDWVHEQTGAQLFGSIPANGFPIKQHPEAPPARRYGIGYDSVANDFPKWNTPYDSTQSGAFDAVYGTSGISPFIIQGGLLEFSIEFETNTAISRAKAANIIADILCNNTGPNSSLYTQSGSSSTSHVTIISAKNQASYNFNLNLRNSSGYSYIDHASSDRRAQKIVAVGNKELIVGTTKDAKFLPPTGFFIVNSARPTFGFTNIKQNAIDYESIPEGESGTIIEQDENVALIALDLVELQNADIMTCIPDVTLRFWADINRPNALFGGNRTYDDFRGWVAMTSSFLYNSLPLKNLAWFLSTFRAGSYDYNAYGVLDVPDALIGTDISGTEIPIEEQVPFTLGNIASVGQAYYDLINGNPIQVAGSVAGDSADQAASKFSAIPQNSAAQVQQINRWFGILQPAGGVVQTVSLQNGVTTTTVTGGTYVYTWDKYVKDIEERDGVNLRAFDDSLSYYNSFAFSLMDGTGGVGEVHPNFLVNTFGNSPEAYPAPTVSQIPGYKYSSVNIFAVRWGNPLFVLISDDPSSQINEENIPPDLIAFPAITGDYTTFSGVGSSFQSVSYTLLSLGAIQKGVDVNQSLILEDWKDDRAGDPYGSRIRLIQLDSFVSQPPPDANEEDSLGDRSFKTGTSHDFAMILYDQRGRASSAIPIGSEVVPTYGEVTNKGRVRMQIQISQDTPPPEWAWGYQLAYAGNSSLIDFIQYSAGGAYVTYRTTDQTINALEEIAAQLQVLDTIDNLLTNQNAIQDIISGIDDAYSEINLDPDAGVSDLIEQILSIRDDIQTESKKIYVSLNYLQGHPDVSYTKAFGATRFDTNPDMYTFRKGDRLRIISYYVGNDADDRVWPVNLEFEIADHVTLEDNDENPLYNDFGEVPEYLRGQFLVLKDNPAAAGFSFSDVLGSVGEDGVSAAQTSTHYWNNRCVFEIYTPASRQTPENRVYYEIGNKYNIIRTENATGGVDLDWQTNLIVTSDGDVWFRRVAVNMPTYRARFNNFRNLVQKDGGSAPRFSDYYLETITFSDVIPGANQMTWGRPHFVNREYGVVKRDSSITFSNVSAPSSIRMHFTQFDATTSNFKDLDNSFGSIQAIEDLGDSVFVIQERKCSSIPISRSTISDVVGDELLVASEKVLGSQVFYAGEYGCDLNPESVKKIGNSIYFANKKRAQVYKWNPSNGIQVISEAGLKSYFRNLFKNAIDRVGGFGPVRVVSGYNPYTDEYLLSVYNDAPVSPDPVNIVIQPEGVIDNDEPIIDPSITSGPTADELALENALDQIDALQAEIDSLQEAYDNLVTSQTFVTTQLTETVVIETGTGDDGGTGDETVSFEQDLLDQLIDTNNQIDEIEQVFVINTQAQVLVHRELHVDVLAKIGSEGSIISFVGFINNLVERPELAENQYQVSPLFVANYLEGSPEVPELAYPAEYGGYLVQVLNKLTELESYWIGDEDSFITRLGDVETFVIGWGAGPNPNPESGIAQFNELGKNFMQELTLNLQIADEMIQFFGIEAAIDAEEELAIKDVTIGVLEEQLNDTVNDIANFVGAFQEVTVNTFTKPSNQIGDVEFIDNGTSPFGEDWVPGNPNLFEGLYEARNTDVQNGDTTSWPTLRDYILNDQTNLNNIKTNIQRGINGYSNLFRDELNLTFDAYDVVNVTKDVLAASAFNSLVAVYNDFLGKPPIIGGTLPANLGFLLQGAQGTVGTNFGPVVVNSLDQDGSGSLTSDEVIDVIDVVQAFGGAVQDLIGGDNTAGTTAAIGDDTKGALQEIYDSATALTDAINVSAATNSTDYTTALDNWAAGQPFGGETLVAAALADLASKLNSDTGATVNKALATMKGAIQNMYLSLDAFNWTRVAGGVFSTAGSEGFLENGEEHPLLADLKADVNNAIQNLSDFQKLFGHFQTSNPGGAGQFRPSAGYQGTVGYADVTLSPTDAAAQGVRASDVLNLANKNYPGLGATSTIKSVQRALFSLSQRVNAMAEQGQISVNVDNDSYVPLDSGNVYFAADFGETGNPLTGAELLPSNLVTTVSLAFAVGGGQTILYNPDDPVSINNNTNAVAQDVVTQMNAIINSSLNPISGSVLANLTTEGGFQGISYGGDLDSSGDVVTADLLELLAALGTNVQEDAVAAFNALGAAVYTDARDNVKQSITAATLQSNLNSIFDGLFGLTLQQLPNGTFGLATGVG